MKRNYDLEFKKYKFGIEKTDRKIMELSFVGNVTRVNVSSFTDLATISGSYIPNNGQYILNED